MTEQFQILLEISQQFLNEIARAIPQIIGALFILIIGWLIAKFVKKICVKLMKLVKLNFLTEKSGVDDFLKHGGLEVTTVNLIGSLIYWIMMLIVIMTTLNTLKLTSAEDIFREIILYIPNIIVAILILLFGLYIAKFVSKAINVPLKNMKAEFANIIRKTLYYTIVTLTIFIVLSQLNIASRIVSIAFLLSFGSICLAFGLAFGLGGKDFAKGVLKKFNGKEENKE